MLDRVLHTKRLKLRPVRAADAKDIAEGIGEWEVIRWLTSPPWPYTLADAEWYANQETMDGKYGIEIDGAVRGNVSISQELEIGYWLAIPYHGHGYMTEAASALAATGVKQAVVTDSGDPASATLGGRTISMSPPRVIVRRYTGAGDVFLSAHISAELRGHHGKSALRRALEAAATYISSETGL